jgi:hypothetical protein
MIEALIAGESDPERLAQLAHRRIKATPEELREALRGRVTRHHRFLLRHRLRARRGAKKAIGALAASILTTVYHMLISGEIYHDLGPAHFDRRAKAAQAHRLATRLQNLGYAVEINPLPAAA